MRVNPTWYEGRIALANRLLCIAGQIPLSHFESALFACSWPLLRVIHDVTFDTLARFNSKLRSLCETAMYFTYSFSIHFSARKRYDVQRGATDDSASESSADAQIGGRSSTPDACTVCLAYEVSYIHGKLRRRRRG
eukprot:2477651-Pleurochrysis_carterae.AAC.2